MKKPGKKFSLKSLIAKSHARTLNPLQEIQKAKVNIAQGQRAAAIQLLNELIIQFPDNIEARHLRCTCYYEMKNFIEALRDSNYILSTGDSETDNMHLNARINIQLGNTTDAEYILTRIMNINQGTTETFYGLGIIKSIQGKLDEAIQFFDEALKCNPHYINAILNRGLLYARQGKELQALMDFENLPQGNNECQSYILTGKGLLSIYKTDYLLALKNLEGAINLFSGNSTAHFYLAFVKANMNLPMAEDPIQKANEYGDDSAYNNEQLTCLLSNTLLKRDVIAAQQIAHQGALKYPNSSKMWETLSLMQFYNADLAQSVISVNKAIVLDEKNMNAWLIRATIKEITGDSQGSQEDITYCASKLGGPSIIIREDLTIEEPKDPFFIDPIRMFLAGCMAYKLGEFELSASMFNKAHEIGHPFSAEMARELIVKILKIQRTHHENDTVDSDKSGIEEKLNSKSIKEYIDELINSEFHDIIKPGKSVSGTTRRKLIRRMYELHQRQITDKTLRSYLSQLDYTRPREHSSDKEYAVKFK